MLKCPAPPRVSINHTAPPRLYCNQQAYCALNVNCNHHAYCATVVCRKTTEKGNPHPPLTSLKFSGSISVGDCMTDHIIARVTVTRVSC